MNWHTWFAWYPVCTIEVGWVWLRRVKRKQIPPDFTCTWQRPMSLKLSEWLTGCWHRIPDECWIL